MTTFNQAAAMGPPMPTNLVELRREVQRLRMQLVQEHDVYAERRATWQLRVRELEQEIENYRALLGLNRR